MSRSRYLLIAALALLGLVLAAAVFLNSSKGLHRAPLNLTVVFTANANAQLEPCGCFTGQYGGLARVKTFLEKQDLPETVRVDAGNAIGGAADYEQIRYRYVQQAFQLLHFDAMNVGARECTLSKSQLVSLGAAPQVPLISANVVDAAIRKPLFPAYRIVQRQGYRIACVGVVDPAAATDLGEGLAVLPMDAALMAILPQVKREADVLLLLAFTDEAGLKKLADAFYEFSIILGGNVPQPSQELIRQNRSYILYTTNETKSLGLCNLTFSHGALPKVDDWDIVLMTDQIPLSKEITALTGAYRKEIRSTALEIDREGHAGNNQVPGIAPAAHYVGSPACTSCHQEAYRIWEQSRHARAFASLQRADSDADPTCIACHTIGFGQPGGYRRAFGPQKLVDVGCEACHGPGSEHVAQQNVGGKVLFKYRPLNESDCRSCHYGKFSRPFEWKTWWPKIAH